MNLTGFRQVVYSKAGSAWLLCWLVERCRDSMAWRWRPCSAVFRCSVVGTKFAANVGLVAILGCKLEIIDGGSKMLGLTER